MARTQIDTAGRTENFVTRNVKLITFLICVAVILSPFVITYIKDVMDAHREAERLEMTVDELVLIAEKGKNLRQSDLSKFEDYREKIETQWDFATYRIPVLHEQDIVLSIGFEAGVAFYMNLTNMDTHEELDLLSQADQLEAFLTTQAN